MANEVLLRLIYHLYCSASMMTAPLQSYYDDTMHVDWAQDFDGISGCSSSMYPCEKTTIVVSNKSPEHHRWIARRRYGTLIMSLS